MRASENLRISDSLNLHVTSKSTRLQAVRVRTYTGSSRVGLVLELRVGTAEAEMTLEIRFELKDADLQRFQASFREARDKSKAAGQPDLVGSLDLKMYFPRELEALVRCNGLRITARYGGHAREAFDEGSRFQILVCEDADK